MWDIKLTVTNEHTRQTNIQNSYTQMTMWLLSEGKGGKGVVKHKGGQLYGSGRDLDLGGEHAVQYTEDVS